MCINYEAGVACSIGDAVCNTILFMFFWAVLAFSLVLHVLVLVVVVVVLFHNYSI